MSNSLSFIKAETNTIIDFISSAKHKIIIAKPAFLSTEVAAILKAKKERNIDIEVYMEDGDSAIRYGFGETVALKMIHDNMAMLNVHVADRIRIAILVVDDKALVYMPNLAFLEEETIKLSFPNGILCNKDATNDLVKQFEDKRSKNISISSYGNVIVFPVIHIPVLDNNEIEAKMKNSIDNLEKSPAIDPVKLKKINFYRNNYKIVKMFVFGVRINNKSLNIKPFYNLLPNRNERLKSSWTIFTSKDIEELQDTKIFESELEKIKNNFKGYLFDAKRFGIIIDVRKKEEFVSAIENLKEDFKDYLRKNTSNEDAIKRFMPKNQKSDIKTILDKSRSELENYLIGLCPEFTIFKDVIFKEYRNLKLDYDRKRKNEKEVIKEFVSQFVSNTLKFTDLDEIIDRIDIKLDFFDVSDELLFENNEFMQIIDEYKLEFRVNSEGYIDLDK